MKRTIILVSLLLITTLFTACDSDEPDPNAGEEELITTVVLTLSPRGTGGQDIVAVYSDPDGEGGVSPIVGELVLNAGTTYDGTVSLVDDTNNIDVTPQIEAEADEHQFWYTAAGSGASRLTINITDEDMKRLPVGLSFTIIVSRGESDTATLNLVLSHYDSAPKDGVTRSDESDIDVTFNVTINGN